MSGCPSDPVPVAPKAQTLVGLTLEYPAELPISARVADIRAALEDHQVVIVAGATGSGKTTQLPKIALQLHAELSAADVEGLDTDGASDGEARPTSRTAHSGRRSKGRAPLIGVTQPRRIAATSVAARVAEELQCELGRQVGYQIRFDDRTSAETPLKFMTDGILLAEIQGDPLLRRYHTLIIDEAHERGLTIDFLLGWLKRLLPKRPELKVIVSSATIETARFSEFFDGAPVIQVEGRTFPVEVLYESPDPDLELAEATANAVENIAALDPEGDFLVFLPGEREISDTERLLVGRRLRHTEILPLYARLSAAEQNKVFSSRSLRRVILATNVAETSLTIPGIVYVVDTGLARISRYEPRTGITRLQVEAISQASAEQRKGRAGRVREGLCVRLFDEANFQARSGFTDPEIRRVGLAGVILRMKSLALGDVESFPFLDAPNARAVAEGYRVLIELGALDEQHELTNLGRQLSRFPVDPRVGRMILAGAEQGVLADVLVLAAALEVQDPRERPRGMEQKADQCHRRFRDEQSDFVGLLKLWSFITDAQQKGSSNLRRVCKDAFLSQRRVREWREVHRQLESSVRELRLQESTRPTLALDRGARVHCALLSGLLSRIGQYNAEHRVYQGARQTRFVLHPGSSLAKKPPPWVMAFELVQTTQLYARTAAKIEPEWLSLVADHLMKRSYSEPHWSEKAGRASVREHATLFGLSVLKDRSVDYATLAPGRARLIFLEHALVRGEYTSAGAFQQANQALLAEVARLRDKARRSDMLSDEEALLTFFDQRVPASVVNGKTFEDWREVVEAQEPQRLFLSLTDALLQDEALHPADYPDELVLYETRLPLSYCFDPAADNDGITVSVPLALIPQIDPARLDWTIPAWHETKIFELLQRVPRSARRDLGSLSELAKRLAKRLTPFSEPMVAALTRAVFELTAVTLSDGALRPDLLPGHLRLTCRVLGNQGKILGESRDIVALFEEHGATAHAAISQTNVDSAFRRTQIRAWDFGELPVSVAQHVLGGDVQLYPALLDCGTCVELSLLPTLQDAEAASRAGVRRLLRLTHERALAALAKSIPNNVVPLSAQASALGPSRAQSDTFRSQMLDRVVAEAFPLPDAALPRNQQDFDQLARAGLARLDGALAAVLGVVSSISAELVHTRRALDDAAKQPSGAAAIRDMRGQLEALFSDDLLARVGLAQMSHFPRYLRGVRLRLERAVVDPRKDAAKLAPFTPVWQAFLAQRAAHPSAQLDALRWAFEELRISLFAPELKPAFAVSVERLQLAVRACA